MARTLIQHAYVDLLRSQRASVVIATGKAGTGKTRLAIVEGAQALLRGNVQRLVLVRPAVSAGEELGYLPGTMDEKMAPFVRPMLDALNTVYTTREINNLREEGRLELAPISFMRGRTFDKAWIVFDEAQNSTPVQMQMVLTRLGRDSKLVATGDLDQCDLAGANGLADFLCRLSPMRRNTLIHHIQLGEEDVQRSEVVKEVLGVYAKTNTRCN